MKIKILILALCLALASMLPAYADTYGTILNDNGYTDIHKNYISKEEIKSILSTVFKKEVSIGAQGVGHATGLDFFNIMDSLGYSNVYVANREIYYNRALTFTSLYDLLDNYFLEISKIHNINSYTGKLSKDSSGYTLTYGEGQVEELLEFNFFKTKEAYLDVIVILKDGRIIDVCPQERGATLSMLTNKREIAGKLFLQHSEGIIIEVNGGLFEYPTLLGFKFLNKKGDNIALIVGSYKKNLELAAVAVGREE